MEIKGLGGSSLPLIKDVSSQKRKLENLSRIFSEKLEGKLSEDKKDKILWEKAKEFEAILIQGMLKSMRKTVEKGKLFHGGLGEDIFESLLDEKYSKKMAETSNFGLAKILYEQLKSKK